MLVFVFVPVSVLVFVSGWRLAWADLVERLAFRACRSTLAAAPLAEHGHEHAQGHGHEGRWPSDPSEFPTSTSAPLSK